MKPNAEMTSAAWYDEGKENGIAEGRRLERESGVEIVIVDLVDGTYRIHTRNGEPIPHSGILIPAEDTP